MEKYVIIYIFHNRMQTLFEKLGGETAVGLVVDKFYDLMLSDQRVNHFYTNSDIKRLKQRQKEFISMVTGGPADYKGTDMKTAHCKFNINNTDFNITWENLQIAMRTYDVPADLIAEVKEIFYSVRQDVVSCQEKPSTSESVCTKETPLVFEPISNKEKVSKCPFKASMAQKSTIKQGEQNHAKLNRNIYMKHFY